MVFRDPSSRRALPSNQRVSRKNAACIRLVKSDAHREAQFLTDVRAARHLGAAGREGDRPILRRTTVITFRSVGNGKRERWRARGGGEERRIREEGAISLMNSRHA